MESLALELVKYLKEEVENFGDSDDLADEYQRIMYALEDMECLATFPEKFQKQEVVEDAWEICYARTCTYVTEDYCAESDIFPRYLAAVGVTPYELCCDVNNIIDERIDSVVDIDDAERLSSDAIEEVVERSTLENAVKICNDYIDYMKSEYDQEMEIWDNNGDPIIVMYDKHITWQAHLNCEKIAEIAETSGSDYFNIEFDWGV